MSRISDARAQLVEAIRAVAPVELRDRVHDVTPNRVDAPCVFIGGASVDRITIGSPGTDMTLVELPVYCVADGRPDQQTRQLDELVAIVWDAAYRCAGHPNGAQPAAIDVGGPSLRGAVVRVELTIAAVSLCTPLLTGATHG